eukprot:Skav230768  [mRNA]  locus=scaffold1473:13472:13723:- [translate_table: standard]
MAQLLLEHGASAPEKDDVHFGITCDGCGVNPITGHRFKCQVCHDWDFCHRCFDRKDHVKAGRCADHAFDRIELRKFLDEVGWQ